MAKKERARKLPDPEHLLVAQVRESRFSYYISSHHSKQVTERVGDEAIIDIVAEITNSEPSQPELMGKPIDCSLICARTFVHDSSERPYQPMLYSMKLRRNERSLLAYLPADAFWALQARLDKATLRCI